MSNIASFIDHTLLKPDATRSQIEKLCREAAEMNFAAVCINPYWVSHASECLKGTPIKVCTVIAFPLGACTTEVKRFAALDAIHNGADELDMVINIGAFKSGDLVHVFEDIQSIVEVADGRIVKVILEISLMTLDEIRHASLLAMEAGAAFVKTSTGFSGSGANVEAVQLMKKTVGNQLGVKASGGIKDLKTAQEMIAAGASRIGCSASISIVS